MSTLWVVTIFCPLLGLLIANVMWLTPLMAVIQARKKRMLGSFNPIPMAAILLNCTGWTIYSFMTKDYFLYFANVTGLLIGAFGCLSAVELLTHDSPVEADENLKGLIERLVIVGEGVWLSAALVTSLSFESTDWRTKMAIGIMCDIGAFCFYAAPLSTMAEVVRTRSSESLLFPAICVNLVNATMWFVYGLAGTKDIFLWLPNGLGVLLALSQLFLIAIFPSRKRSDSVPLKPPHSALCESSQEDMLDSSPKDEILDVSVTRIIPSDEIV